MRARVSILSLVTQSAVIEERREAVFPCSFTPHTLSANIRTYTPQSYAAVWRKKEEGTGSSKDQTNFLSSSLTVLLLGTVDHFKGGRGCS